MNPQYKFPYKWYLKDGYPAKDIELHNKTVFSTFSCGGGSSMGYKLAGYKVIAANDIDNQMRQVYIANHHPKYYIYGDIRKLLTLDYPQEFYNLDILDGSPPCSTFSMAGAREKAWGKEKQFREGQALQTLDDLFFDFIALAKKLQPKVVISENVKGLISGNAKGYFIEIIKQFSEAGYETQSFLLNASTMGVPQRRERVFLLCKRKDLNLPKIEMSFNEKSIYYKEFKSGEGKKLGADSLYLKRWKNRIHGDRSLADSAMRMEGKNKAFSERYIYLNEVPATMTAKDDCLLRYDSPEWISKEDAISISSFPQDYNFLSIKPNYLGGMSVPPIMMAQVAYQVYKQWLSAS